MDIGNDLIKYPQAGDKFFVEHGETDKIAWLQKRLQTFDNYANCYKNGANTFIDKSLNDRELRDDLIYPLVFIIRHYIEIRLKSMIQELNYYLEFKSDFPNGHNLILLWDKFASKYKASGGNTNRDEFNTMKCLIKEFHDVDPNSEAFRYPVDKKGEVTQTMEFINYLHLQDTFEKVCNLLDGISNETSILCDINKDIVHDLMSDLYSDYR